MDELVQLEKRQDAFLTREGESEQGKVEGVEDRASAEKEDVDSDHEMEDLPEAEQGEEVTEEMQAAAAEAGEVDKGKRVLEGDDLSQPEAVQAVTAT
eukprot:6470107-Alexandrium_andersonii.AAC.1